MTKRLTHGLLAGLVLVYLLLAGAYSAITPAATPEQHNPDENAHMQYVQTLASGHLPVFTDAMHGYENHQPPLYYALAAPVYLAAQGRGEAVATRAVRAVSILLGALLIVASYRCIRTLFPDEPWLALGTAAGVGLLPGNVALSASVTNDALTNLVMVVALGLLARLVTATELGDRTRWALWLGVTLGAGVWTKTSALVLFPTVLLVCYLLAARHLATTAQAARAAMVACGLGGIIGLPWLLRNQLLYGDPLAQHIFVSAFSNTAQADIIARALYGGSILSYLGGVAQWTFASFWGGFDSMLIFWGQDPRAHRRPNEPGAYSFLAHPPPLPYALLALLCLAAALGLFRAGGRRAALTPPQNILLAAFLVLTALTGLVFLRFILTFFQAQGRYWYPALLPLAFFFVLGWRGLLPRPAWFPAFVGVWAAGLVALNLYTLFGLLLPRFSQP
jgi:hypothetical protein